MSYGIGQSKLDELSPVSALRTNFDQLKSETTDIVSEQRNIFGVSFPQFVPQRVISWIENNANKQCESDNDPEISSNISASNTSGNEQCCSVSRKVCMCE